MEDREPAGWQSDLGDKKESGFKAPPPSPRLQAKSTPNPRLGRRARSRKLRFQLSLGSSMFGGSGEGKRDEEADVRHSFAELSRSKSRTITFSAAESMAQEIPGKESESEATIGVKHSSWKRKSCQCLVAFAGDCAALCCCPCTILHILALICIRFPVTMMCGVYSRMRRRSGSKNVAGSEFDATGVVRSSFNSWPFGEQLVIDFPPYPGGFGDQKHWSFFDHGVSDGSLESHNHRKKSM